jgi:hypothetical protein
MADGSSTSLFLYDMEYMGVPISFNQKLSTIFLLGEFTVVFAWAKTAAATNTIITVTKILLSSIAIVLGGKFTH